MLVHAHKLQLILFHDGAHFGQHVRVHTELGLLAAGHHLVAVARTDAGIEAHHDAAAGAGTAEEFQLGKGIHADHASVIDGILQFFGAYVVADVGDLVGSEAREAVDMKFAGAHGVHHAAFGTDDAKKRGVGVGLGGIVHMKTGKAAKPCKVAAAGAQNVFIINIQGRAETGDQFAGVFLPVKVHTVGIGGSYVCHVLFFP